MKKPMTSMFLAVLSCSASFAADVRQVLNESGVRGGIIVRIGWDDPRELAALRAGEAYVVHGLDTDADKVAAARAFLSAEELNGPVSVSLFDGQRLPYINNLVNLVIVDRLGPLTKDDLLRVLTPHGVAMIGGEKLVKPYPQEMDEWPQYLHGADNNAVSQDQLVGPPRHVQWVTGPAWSRSHMGVATLSGMVTARGRIFTIVDKSTSENPFLPAKFTLVARDAFNGFLLWEHPFRDWEPVTRYIKDVSVQMKRRLAAVDDKVYCTPALDAPLTMFDAATGEILKVYQQTGKTQEFVFHDGLLYTLVGDPMRSKDYNHVKTQSSKGIDTGGTDPQSPFAGSGFRRGYSREQKNLTQTGCRIVAVEAASGKTRWVGDEIVNYIGASLALDGDHAVYRSEAGVTCVNAKTGRSIWSTKTDAPTEGKKTKKVPSSNDKPNYNSTADALVISGQTVYTTGARKINAYSLEDGSWKWSSSARGGYETSPDLFVIGGTPWTGAMGAPTAYDRETGQPKTTIQQIMQGPMGHDRCYRNLITERFYINSKTGGADFLDLKTKREFPNHWVRGTCGVGVLPANGMLYAPPYSCQCSMGSMIKNFNALYTEESLKTPDQMIEVKRSVRLVKGPAYQKATGPAASSSDWPTYRQNGARGGIAAQTVPGVLKERWKVNFTGTPSAPVVVGDKVFVSDVDAHTVYALQVVDGQTAWRYTAGGRVDTPPTYFQGMVLFGARDGWVTCLRASDGALAWSFKDLPDKLIGAFGQLESAWPVNGSVLIKDDAVYFAAGRSSFLDGGIFLYALDPPTGEVLYSRQIYGPFDEEHGFPSTSNRTDSGLLDGFKGDLMVTDGDRLFVRHKAFESDLSTASESRPHLIPSAGFLDRTPQHRTYWTVGQSYNWTRVAGADCDILVVQRDTYYGVQGFQTHRHSYFDPRKSGYKLIAGNTSAKGHTVHWTADIPLTGKAIVKAGENLFIAGTPMKFPGNPFEKYVESYEERLGGMLWIASAEDGKKIAEYQLEAAPAWDAMAAAGGRLFLSLKDGSIRCYSGN